MDPKKADAFCWKNGKRKIYESIYYMPRPQLLLPPLSRLLQLPLGIAAMRSQHKSLSFTIIHQNFCQHLQPWFLNLSKHNQSWRRVSEAPPSSWVYVCFTKNFTSRTAKTHFICGSLLLSWCFSFCNVFRCRFLAIEPTLSLSLYRAWRRALQCQVQLVELVWASCDSTNTQITVE